MVAKYNFEKNKKKIKGRELKPRGAEAPEDQYSQRMADEEFNNQDTVRKSKVGRKRKNGSYRNVRTTVDNVQKMTAMETVLNINSHNDLLSLLLSHMENSIPNDELSTYRLIVQSYERRANKSN